MGTKSGRIRKLLMADIKELSNKGLSKLPTEKELCEKYGVSRQTLRKASDQLVAEGFLKRLQGSGCYLTEAGCKLAGKRVCLIIGTDSEYLDPSIIHNLKKFLQSEGISLDVFTSDNSLAKEYELIDIINQRAYFATIFFPSASALFFPREDILSDIAGINHPFIFVGDKCPGITVPNCISISTDDFLGGYKMAEFLIKSGHTQIGGIFKVDDLSGINRYKGYIKALQDSNLRFSDSDIIWYTTKDLLSLRAKKDMSLFSLEYEQNRRTCSAILCNSDEIAYWYSKFISNNSSLSSQRIASFGGTYLCDFGSTHFDSLSLDLEHLCKELVSLIKLSQKGETIHDTTISWGTIKQ